VIKLAKEKYEGKFCQRKAFELTKGCYSRKINFVKLVKITTRPTFEEHLRRWEEKISFLILKININHVRF
jgi:hypothetical protein